MVMSIVRTRTPPPASATDTPPLVRAEDSNPVATMTARCVLLPMTALSVSMYKKHLLTASDIESAVIVEEDRKELHGRDTELWIAWSTGSPEIGSCTDTTVRTSSLDDFDVHRS